MKYIFSLSAFLLFFIPLRGQFTIIQSDNGGIYPHGLSSDGNYVVGQVGEALQYAGHHTFVWSPAAGLVEWDQHSADSDGVGSSGFAISKTGRVAGVAPDSAIMVNFIEGGDRQVPLITASFRDYASPAWTTLPLLPDILSPFDGFGSRAYGISDDGKIIVGGQTPGGQSQRLSAGYWDVSNPAQAVYHPLLTETKIGYGSEARAISGDKQIIGGQETDNGKKYTVLWINGEKKRITGASSDPVMAISNNGKYAVFQSNLRATLYTIATDQLETFDLSAEIASTPLAVSDNGIVVGHWNTAGNNRTAFIYTRSLGMVSLESFLQSRNIDFPLSSISSVSGISANGRIITGFGTLNKKTVGFYAEIPEIPTDVFPVRNTGVNTPVYGTVELSWEAPEIPEGEYPPLVTYHIYEGETPIDTVEASTNTRTFTGVTDGTYLYFVKAVYEKDGGQVEAIAGKTVAVTMSKKNILFYDSFSDYQTGGLQLNQTFQEEIPLSTGGWDVSAHTVPFSESWAVSNSGRPPCSAGFIAPLSGEYSETLSSPFFDLREAEDLFLAFDVGVPNASLPNQERLAVEIYDGAQWHGVDTIPADGGSALFTNFYYDVSEYAGKDNVRLRFRCFGTATTGINWFVDNVELTDGAGRVSIAEPLVISARAAGNGKVHINWSDPYGTVSLRYMFNDDAFGALGNNQYPYIVANMYPAEDLSAYEGYYLTSISFWRTTNDEVTLTKPTRFRWFASRGGERIVDMEVVDPKLKWNTVQLENPVQIDVTKPLYYGVEIVDADPNDLPVGSGTYNKPGAGPYDAYVNMDKIDGRGNLYSEDDGQTWRKVSDDGETFFYDLFCVRATLSKNPTPVSPLATRRITGYKIYRNGQSLLEEEQGEDYSIKLNNFTDEHPSSGNLCYTVKTFFYDYEARNILSEGVSDCITVNGVALVRDANGWNVYPNPVKRGEIIGVEIEDAVNRANATIKIYDLDGKLVKKVPVTGQITPVGMDVASGTYVLQIGGKSAFRVVVK